MSEEQLLKLHIEEDRIAFARLEALQVTQDKKLDDIAISLAKLSTKFAMASTAVGFISGVVGAVIVAVLTQ